MTQQLFLRLVHVVEEHNDWFQQRRNGAGTLGCSPLQKVTATVRMLAYSGLADALDEVLRISKSTIIDSLKRFVWAIHAIFGPQYLRRPNQEDLVRLLAKAKERGFPGMIGSLDCMHWCWEKCLVAWQGMYVG